MKTAYCTDQNGTCEPGERCNCEMPETSPFRKGSKLRAQHDQLKADGALPDAQVVWMQENDIDPETVSAAKMEYGIYLRGFSRKYSKFVGALKHINLAVRA